MISVTIRAYLVNRNLLPLGHRILVSIVGPDDVIYENDVMRPNESVSGVPGLYQLEFDFPVLAKQGLWTIRVRVHGIA